MKFQEITKKCSVKNLVTDYLNYAQILDDLGVNEKIITVIEKTIEQQIFTRYANYEIRYDEKYCLDMLSVYIIDSIPELVQHCLKNSVMISKIFREYKTIHGINASESEIVNSYGGMNVEGDYSKSKTKNTSTSSNPIALLYSFNLEFRKSIDILKNDIENLLILIYML